MRPYRPSITVLGVILIVMALVLGACNLPASQGPTVPGTSPAGPPATSPAAGSGAIGGRIWNDVCSPLADNPVPPGCVAGDAPGGAHGNGILEAGEAGIGGVRVSLGAGVCPSIVPLGSSISAGDGTYPLTGLVAGTYCVAVDPAGQDVLTILGGIWTLPAGGDPGGVASVTMTLGEGEIRGDVNFGWDYTDAAATAAPPPPSDTPVPSAETPTPTTTLTPTATTSATDPRTTLGQPDWRDAFDTGGNWPLYADTHVRFEVSSGSLAMTAFNADYWDGWMLTYPVITDLYLEMSATPGDCSGQDRYGLVFRSSSSPQGYVGYMFSASCDGRYSLRSWDGEEYTSLIAWTTSDRITAGPNHANRLGVWAQGNRITLYLNGNQVGEVHDTTHAGGMFGVLVGAVSTPNFTARVDEIAYWTLP
jgi:hypothetical protein